MHYVDNQNPLELRKKRLRDGEKEAKEGWLIAELTLLWASILEEGTASTCYLFNYFTNV